MKTTENKSSQNTSMEDDEYDFVVIGAGSAGVRAARIAGQLGAKTLLIENQKPGGTCVHRGCIPKKLFVYGGDFHDNFEAAKAYGWNAEVPAFHFPSLRDRVRAETDRLGTIYQGISEKAGVELVRGTGKLVAANRVRIETTDGFREVSAKKIMIAVGGRPRKLSCAGAELTIDSDDVFNLKTLPKSIVIIGTGYIALEFASFFVDWGVDVRIVARHDRLLTHFDAEVGSFVEQELVRRGVQFTKSCEAQSFEKVGDEIVVTLTNGQTIKAEAVLAAIGRVSRADETGVFEFGAERNAFGGIAVNEHFETTVPGVYAVGDVRAEIQLTPVALAEGMYVAQHLFAAKSSGIVPRKVDALNIPTAIFIRPEVATVGLSEEQALQAGKKLRIYTSSFRPLFHTISGLEHRTFMKLIVDDESDRIVGIHMAGDHSAESIQGFAVAFTMGATKADFDRTLGIHPSSGEEFVTMRNVTRLAGG